MRFGRPFLQDGGNLFAAGVSKYAEFIGSSESFRAETASLCNFLDQKVRLILLVARKVRLGSVL